MSKSLNGIRRQLLKLSPLRDLIHWIAVLGWIAITLLVWSYARNQEHIRLEQQFEREAHQLVDLVRDRLTKYEDVLSSAAAMVHSHSVDFTAKEWRGYAEALNANETYPGVVGMAVVFAVDQGDLEAFLAWQRKTRPEFQIHPFRDASTYFPLAYIAPLAPNASAVGLDLGFEPNRVRAIERALDTGLAQMTAPVGLVQSSGTTPSVIQLKAFARGAPDATSISGRFQGVVTLPFVVEGLMSGVLGEERRPVRTRISDSGVVLYNEAPTDSPDLNFTPLFSTRIEAALYGRNWEFEIWSIARFEEEKSNQPMVILIAGLIIGVLLFLLLRYMARAHRQALQIAEELGAEARAQRAIAIQASKMASLGQMAGGIAHEINNPLATISANAAIIEMSLSQANFKSNAVSKGVEAIKATVQRMAEIVSGLRMVTGKESEAPPDRVNIGDTWDLTYSFSLDRLNNYGIRVINKLPRDVWVMANQTHISQVLLNLLNNSIDAISDLEERWIQIESSDLGSRHQVRMSDSGRGIPTAQVDRLFDPFFTTKEVGKGTGLGLSICVGIIATYGGRLYYDRQAEHTTFVFELPKASDGKDRSKKDRST